MNTLPFFHRPPTSGIHLLSDPFPIRLNADTSLFKKAETLSLQREYIAPLRNGAKVESKKR